MDKKRKSLRDFAPVGKKECESKCEREVAMTPDGPVVSVSYTHLTLPTNREV